MKRSHLILILCLSATTSLAQVKLSTRGPVQCDSMYHYTNGRHTQIDYFYHTYSKDGSHTILHKSVYKSNNKWLLSYDSFKYTYNATGQMIQSVYMDPSGSHLYENYVYDSKGRLTREEKARGGNVYSYKNYTYYEDEDKVLIEEREGDWPEQYIFYAETYDSEGRVLIHEVLSNNRSKILERTVYEYDNDGNVKSQAEYKAEFVWLDNPVDPWNLVQTGKTESVLNDEGNVESIIYYMLMNDQWVMDKKYMYTYYHDGRPSPLITRYGTWWEDEYKEWYMSQKNILTKDEYGNIVVELNYVYNSLSGEQNASSSYSYWNDYTYDEYGNILNVWKKRYDLTNNSCTSDGTGEVYFYSDQHDTTWTTIEEIKVDNPSTNSPTLYDLQGRQLKQKPKKGIYIQNDKKVMVK